MPATARASWPEGDVLLSWLAPDELETSPVTAAHCFCFRGPDVLVVQHRSRGFCIPGGHLEPGEEPEAALARELLEEASVAASSFRLLGGVQVDHAANPRFRKQGRYPRVAVQLIYSTAVAAVHPFRAEHETLGRRFVPWTELASVHHEWNPVLQAAFDAAMDAEGTR